MACETGLTMEMLTHMDVGGVMDYIYEWIETHTADKKGREITATQQHMDAF